MESLIQTLEIVYSMDIGQTIEFISGAIVVRTGRDANRVQDKNGKTYSNLNNDHAAMIAHAGE